MSVSYYSIPSKQLAHFLAVRNAEAIVSALIESQPSHQPFPYTLQHISIDAYATLHDLLVPTDAGETVLRHTLKGGHLFALGSDEVADVTSLYEPRYLDSLLVKRITQAMLALSLGEVVDRFALLHAISNDADVFTIAHHPAYEYVMTEYDRLLCFFHIAARLNYSIVRWYSD